MADSIIINGVKWTVGDKVRCTGVIINIENHGDDFVDMVGVITRIDPTWDETTGRGKICEHCGPIYVDFGGYQWWCKPGFNIVRVCSPQVVPLRVRRKLQLA